MKVFHGRSALNPARDIMVWVTLKSGNRKTGDMVQVYLLDADEPPAAAVKSGADVSVCGTCKLRPLIHKQRLQAEMVTMLGDMGLRPKPCYVQKGWLRGTWEAARRAEVTPLAEAAHRIEATGKPVRLGAYGDPAAAPFFLMSRLAYAGKGWTGYTHQWKDVSLRFREICMASADTANERLQAQVLGYRTFHVTQKGSAGPIAPDVVCPASKEAGARTTCAKCRLCNGTERRGSSFKSITIAAH